MNADFELSTDAALLKRYVVDAEESAFAEIVRRRLPLVYGTALRRLAGDSPGAEDVAQTVFLALAKQARSLAGHPSLAGWLYTTAVHHATDQVRRRQRRQTHEHRIRMNSDNTPSSEPDWAELQPVLDDAMQDLQEPDRHAVVLRFLEQRPFAEVGRELGLSEDAARMRVSRALEKLRTRLAARGLLSSTAALGASLSSQPLIRVPAQLAATILQAVQPLAPAAAGAFAWAGATWKIGAAALTVIGIAGGLRLVTLEKQGKGPESFSARAKALGATATNRAHAMLPFGRPTLLRGAAPTNHTLKGLALLRSALFDTTLGNAKRYEFMRESAGLLVGSEMETISLLREALKVSDPGTVSLAIEATGHFGLPLMQAMGPDLFALLKDGNFNDPDQAGLLANRLTASFTRTNAPVAALVDLFQQRPELHDALRTLLTTAIELDPPRLAENRERVKALLNDPHVEVKEAAKQILAETPQPKPPLTSESAQRLAERLLSPQASERSQGLTRVWVSGQTTPEIREAIAHLLLHDPLVSIRVTARQVLEALAPNDPALQPAGIAEAGTDGEAFKAQLAKHQLTIPEMLDSLATRPSEIAAVCEQLGGVPSSYWKAHPGDKLSAVQCLGVLSNNRDAQACESADAALARIDPSRPRAVYRLDELQPFFDAMEASLKPGDYGIALRDLRPGVEAYWKSRNFIQSEPTHLLATDVRMLLVGPYHQNRAAYDSMLEAIQRIDPNFRATPE